MERSFLPIPKTLCLSLALVLAACGAERSSQQATQEAQAQATVGVTLLTLTHPFFLDLIDGLEAEAARHNLRLVITSGEHDVARQQNQVSDFIVQRVDAIVLCPTDSRAIGTSIRAANEAGIPVFTADIASLAEGVRVVTHVGIDNYQAGRMAAQAALEALGGKGKIAVIDHPEVESVIQRTRGFREVVEAAKANGAAVEIVTVLPAGGAQDRAFRVAEDILQAHPDVDLVFGINDETALGAVAAIEKAGKAGQVRVVGVGGKLEARRAVREGRLFADVITHPRQIGILSIQAVARYMAGEALPAATLIPTTLYRRADALADSTLPAAAPG